MAAANQTLLQMMGGPLLQDPGFLNKLLQESLKLGGRGKPAFEIPYSEGTPDGSGDPNKLPPYDRSNPAFVLPYDLTDPNAGVDPNGGPSLAPMPGVYPDGTTVPGAGAKGFQPYPNTPEYNPGTGPGAGGGPATNAGYMPGKQQPGVKIPKGRSKVQTQNNIQASGKPVNQVQMPVETETETNLGAADNPSHGLSLLNILGIGAGALSPVLSNAAGLFSGPSPGEQVSAKNVTNGPATRIGDLTRIEEKYTPYAFGEQQKSLDQMDNIDPRAQTLQAIGGLTDARGAAMQAALNAAASGQGGLGGSVMADALKGSSQAMAAGAGYDQAIAQQQTALTQTEGQLATERANMADQIGNRSGEVLYLQGIEDLGTETEQSVTGGNGFLDILSGAGTTILDVMTGGTMGGGLMNLIGRLAQGVNTKQKTTGSPGAGYYDDNQNDGATTNPFPYGTGGNTPRPRRSRALG